MKRRDFSLAVAAAAIPTALGLPTLAHAQPAFVEGKNYTKLDKPVTSNVPNGKVEVIEFFWYGCNHCNAFEPMMDAWAKTAPAYLQLRRVHIAFSSHLGYVLPQKLFYTLQGMGEETLQALHAKVFRAIHVEKRRWSEEKAIFDWVAKQGVDVEKFKAMYNSFTVATQVKQAMQLQDSYQVEGVPSMGVAGRYYVDGGKAGSMENVLKVVEYQG